MDEPERLLGLRQGRAQDGFALPRLGIIDARNSRQDGGPPPYFLLGHRDGLDVYCLSAGIDSQDPGRHFLERDVVLLHLPGRNLPSFAAERDVGMGTGQDWLRRVTRPPPGVAAGWRLFTADGRWPFAAPFIEWLARAAEAPDIAPGLCAHGGGNWLALDRSRRFAAGPDADGLRQWLDFAIGEARALADSLPDLAPLAESSVESLATRRPGGLKVARRRTPEPVGLLPAALGMLLLCLFSAALFASGLYFFDESGELPSDAGPLARVALLVIMGGLTVRLVRIEQREVPAHGQWHRMWQGLSPMLAFTWQFIAVAYLILQVAWHVV